MHSVHSARGADGRSQPNPRLALTQVQAAEGGTARPAARGQFLIVSVPGPPAQASSWSPPSILSLPRWPLKAFRGRGPGGHWAGRTRRRHRARRGREAVLRHGVGHLSHHVIRDAGRKPRFQSRTLSSTSHDRSVSSLIVTTNRVPRRADFADLVEALVRRARDASSGDDITALVVACGPHPSLDATAA